MKNSEGFQRKRSGVFHRERSGVSQRKRMGIVGLYCALCLLAQIITNPVEIYAKENMDGMNLHAEAYVLMDADSGRVLFSKNGEEKRAIASTTKIVTCILLLENGKETDYVTVSKNASRQPKVRAGLLEGEIYQVKDLLYAMMLESYNDTAVALAEYLCGSTQAFADRMNALAQKVGCESAFFITPNGLDAKEQATAGISNGASAKDLAKLFRYCVLQSPKKERFLEITRTAAWGFSNYLVNERGEYVQGKHYQTAYNKNRYLTMREGAYSGKTGFTNAAGYCYVGGVKEQDRDLIVVLLGASWPPHKNDKWKDAEVLVNYGVNHTFLQVIDTSEVQLSDLNIEKQKLSITPQAKTFTLLLKEEELLQKRVLLEKNLKTPVYAGQKVGEVAYYLETERIFAVPITADFTIEKKNFKWYFRKIYHRLVNDIKKVRNIKKIM